MYILTAKHESGRKIARIPRLGSNILSHPKMSKALPCCLYIIVHKYKYLLHLIKLGMEYIHLVINFDANVASV